MEKYKTDKGKEFDRQEQIFIPTWQRLEQLKELARADLKTLLAEGEKITPKAWGTEKEQLEKEVPTFRSERARACHDLAFAEVISCNRANLERVEQNESRQHNKQQSRTKRREEEI